MSDDELVIHTSTTTPSLEPAEHDADASAPTAAAPSVASTIVGSLHAEIADAEASTTRELRVGKLPSLWARYRALTRDEREELEHAARARRTLKRKVSRGAGADAGEEELGAARLLVKSLEELLWQREDGRRVPLAEALREDGVEVDGPLRYNAELVNVLQLDELVGSDEERPPSAVEVVTALHRWGDDHMPLLTNARILSTWMSAVTAQALEEVIEGI